MGGRVVTKRGKLAQKTDAAMVRRPLVLHKIVIPVSGRSKYAVKRRDQRRWCDGDVMGL